MKHIVYNNGNGISVITPTEDGILEVNKIIESLEVEMTAIDFIIQKDVPRIIGGKLESWNPELWSFEDWAAYPMPDYKIVNKSDFPADRIFRNAWGYDLKEDIEKSKEIKKDMLRKEREPLLASLDVDYIKATEKGDDITAIVSEKQRLIDITKDVDGIATIEELKAFKI